MVKRKSTKLPASTSDLAADPRNPRFINSQAQDGLSASLAEFGDLSGIVWNKRTGELVTGHQRLEQIKAKWGEQTIEVADAAAELGLIHVDKDHAFAVRVVDWPREKQIAANATANNPLIQGEFTDGLADYLADARTALAESSPMLFDDLLLMDLMAAHTPADEATELKPIDVKPPPAMVWVLVGIETPRFGRIAAVIDSLAAIPDVTIEATATDRG